VVRQPNIKAGHYPVAFRGWESNRKVTCRVFFSKLIPDLLIRNFDFRGLK
jgi:hypothetical protein